MNILGLLGEFLGLRPTQEVETGAGSKDRFIKRERWYWKQEELKKRLKEDDELLLMVTAKRRGYGQ